MGNYPELDIDAAHDGIIAAVQAKFPALRTVADYDRQKGTIPCPAVLVAFESIDSAGAPANGQTPVRIRWQLVLLLKFNAKNVHREIRKLIAAMSLFVSGNTFSLPCSPCSLVGAYSETFADDLGSYEAWRVDFEMEAFLGESIWTGEGVIPAEVKIMSSWAPEIGEGHKDDYEEVEDVPAANS